MTWNVLTSLANNSYLQCLITSQSSEINVLKSEGRTKFPVGPPKIFKIKEFLNMYVILPIRN